MDALTDEVPAFLRDPTTATQVGELSREPDRSKGAGKIHDSNRDPAHFVDLDDAGLVMGGPRFEAPLPPTRADYEALLQAAGTDSWKAGYLQYSIVDQYQQLTLDFAYWRVLIAAEARETDPGRRAWYAQDRILREGLLKTTIGRRRVSEMEEIKDTFDHLGLTPHLFQGVADMYRMIGSTSMGDETPESRDTERSLEETIRLLAEWVQAHPA